MSAFSLGRWEGFLEEEEEEAKEEEEEKEKNPHGTPEGSVPWKCVHDSKHYIAPCADTCCLWFSQTSTVQVADTTGSPEPSAAFKVRSEDPRDQH